MTKRLLFIVTIVVLVGLLTGCVSVPQPQQSITITPYPSKLIEHPGNFTLTRSTSLNNNSSELDVMTLYFRDKLSASTGYKFASGNQTKNAINIVLDPQSGIAVEGYKLNVKKDVIEIIASTTRGAFYGMQSLLQLLPSDIESRTKVKSIAWIIPCVTIEDEPRFDYRGVMIDAARHFVPVDQIKKMLDVFALYKINKFHWHLTEDQLWTIEIKKYPKLTELGSKRIEVDGTIHEGFYTQEDIRHIVAYAMDRGIDVVPEIEMPGHALAAIVAYPWLSCKGEGDFKVRNLWGVESDVYCAGKESTFEFVADVLTEVIDLFPYEYIHIGGDECPKERWKECKMCQKRIKEERLKDEHHLQSYFIHRVEKMLNDKGRKLIGWDEIIDGGLSPTATVMYWRSWVKEKSVMDTLGVDNKIIMTPLGHMYFNFYQGRHEAEPQIAHGQYLPLKSVYDYDPYNKDVSAERYKKIWGVQANLWTEYIYDGSGLEYMLFPRVIALAEIGWSSQDNRSYNRFAGSLDNQLVRLAHREVNYHIPMPEGPLYEDLKFIDDITVEFSNSGNYPMIYTLDGTTPDASSMYYNAPITVDSDCVLKIATLLPNGKMGLRSFTIRRETPAPAHITESKAGIVRKLSKDSFKSLSELSGAKWEKDEVINDFSFPFKELVLTGAAIYTGYIELPEDGAYIFASDADELQIDGKSLIINDGKLAMHQLSRASIVLAKGKHSFQLTFTNTPHGGHERVYDRVGFMYSVNGSKLNWSTPEMLSH